MSQQRFQLSANAPTSSSLAFNNHPRQTESTTPSPIAIPTITLPKGGGAIGGVGEKVDVNPATGTATLSIPLVTSPARGFEPQLTLTYSSGSGNSPFGLGWSLSLPSITRKTEKGIPRYQDSVESDVFILAGMDDLVPIFERNETEWVVTDHIGKSVPQDEIRGDYVVRKYSSRVNDTFVRIERWTKQGPRVGEIHWRTITPNNTTSIYGRDNNSRIFDPKSDCDELRIFSWLIAETYDSKGNAIIFNYKEENSLNVDVHQTHEANRNDITRSSNRYISTIKYGNTRPNRHLNSWEAYSPFELSDNEWLFTVAFDYGEYDLHFPQVKDDDPWLCRLDPFSVYRSGFEIRTYRLCRRILMFHHFPELKRRDCLVNSTDLTYEQNPSLTYLKSFTKTGHVFDGRNYRSKSFPPVEFEYAKFPSDEELSSLKVREITARNVPPGMANCQWVDLDGEGLAGLLCEQYGGGWHYIRNLSANNSIIEGGHAETVAKFAPPEQVYPKPNASITRQPFFFADVAGDGATDLVGTQRGIWGYYKRLIEKPGWMSFYPFRSFPNINANDANVRFIDLTGDGIPDILFTDNQAFLWYPSLGYDGFGEQHRTNQSIDEEKGPSLIFADLDNSIYLADMSGDGLVDLVRVRNGQVCYWPNTGYGCFGAKVTMCNSPWFAESDQFNQARIRIADVDGSGTNDIIYVAHDGVNIYRNLAGNAFTDPKRVPISPNCSLSQVTAIDLLGTGTISLLWTSVLPGDSNIPIKYIDFTNGQKPHLLTGRNNNMGAETRIYYSPSTKYYLDDKKAGKDWITRLPFPVQCVEKVEVFDHVSHNRFVDRYAYHHGYYDGHEREYRGFAMVEKWDTEEFDIMSTQSAFNEIGTNINASWHAPPVYTRTWFHTGNYDGNIGRSLANEYFGMEDDTNTLPDSCVPPGLNYFETRECCRALAGNLLREEVYAQDDSEESGVPYTITENNYTVDTLQLPPDTHLHSIVAVHPRESILYNMERDSTDPRTTHTLILQTDLYGNVLKRVDVAYGKKDGYPAQTKELILYTENDFTSTINEANDYLLPQQCETRAYELHGFKKARSLRDFLERLSDFDEIPFCAEGTEGLQRRLTERSRTLFRSNDLARLLPLGSTESMRIFGESYMLSLTPELVSAVYRRRSDDACLVAPEMLEGTDGSSGGYVDLDGDGNWWVPSGRIYFAENLDNELEKARTRFFTVRRQINPFNTDRIVFYDAHDLRAKGVVDAVGNITSSEIDYRVLEPMLVTDPNGNRSQCAFDELGLVVGTAITGKATEQMGDSLDGFNAILSQQDIDEYFADPQSVGKRLIGNATTRTIYDLSRFYREAKPIYYSTIARETHHDVVDLKTQVGFHFYNGLQQNIQTKVQAEPTATHRWIATGWTVFNNKGLPVQHYEPFFDASLDFVYDRKEGVSQFIFYDPVGRVIAVLNPNNTWRKSVIGAWCIKEYDENDTILIDPLSDENVGQLFSGIYCLPSWYEARCNGQLGREEQLAAQKAAVHNNTPSISYLDPLRREVVKVVDNGSERKYQTFITFDIQGNQRQVTDPEGRIITKFDYGLRGEKIHQASMEAGERWFLYDVFGYQIYKWDSRMNRTRACYDSLRRPIEQHLQSHAKELLVNRIVYGENDANNARTRVVQIYDQAGVITYEQYDFKGNLIWQRRQIAKEYRATIDWNSPVDLEGSFVNSTSYDALNRPVELAAPDYRTRQFYDASGQLSRIEGIVGNKTIHYVKNIQYNAKMQRTRIDYGNETYTTYAYDPLTFRLHCLHTVRPASKGSCHLQNLTYTYDPVGNISHIRDDAQQTIFFRNQVVGASNDYVYDPVYRLIQATGREHIALATPNSPSVFHPHNGQAMARYLETYMYDRSGNYLSVKHHNDISPWTLKYEYDEPSLLEPERRTNRLSFTRLGALAHKYSYSGNDGLHGNLTSMPELSTLKWDYDDQLRMTAKQVVHDGNGETTWYVYDSTGRRVRKVTDHTTPTGRRRLRERIYLDGFEIYQKFDRNGICKGRRTIEIKDGESRVALVDSEGTEILVRYQIADHLQSVKIELDQGGRLISYEEYRPYGETSYYTPKTHKRYRYIAKERDKESGLYYNGLRYYHCTIGRWINCDPIGIDGGLNLYRYANCDPINMSDPSGTNPILRAITAIWHYIASFFRPAVVRARPVEEEGSPLVERPASQRRKKKSTRSKRQGPNSESRPLIEPPISGESSMLTSESSLRQRNPTSQGATSQSVEGVDTGPWESVTSRTNVRPPRQTTFTNAEIQQALGESLPNGRNQGDFWSPNSVEVSAFPRGRNPVQQRPAARVMEIQYSGSDLFENQSQGILLPRFELLINNFVGSTPQLSNVVAARVRYVR